MSVTKLLRAKWVAPIDRELLRDGAVAYIGDTIVDVGPFNQVQRRNPKATVRELGNVILLPGLVNAHVHLELSLIPRVGISFGEAFVDWLLAVMRHPVDAAAGTREGIAQCQKFGISAVGDITRDCAITRPLLASSRLAGISYGEITAMGRRRILQDERLAAASNLRWQTTRLRIGISPHAPYSIEPEGYLRALQTRLPIATHLAETPEEAEFLARHDGPFRRLWNTIGGFDDLVPTFAQGPIRMASTLGLLAAPTLLAHVNVVDDSEMGLLAGGRASVVYCPRTHAYFHRPPHRWREMLERGVNVALGTDSCASSGDLNLVDDLRWVYREATDVPVEKLWEMVTIRGARAVGLADSLGTLSIGKSAEVIAFDISGDDPLREILESSVLPTFGATAGDRWPT